MWNLLGKNFKSRFLLGTSGYPSPEILKRSILESEVEIVTMSLRRSGGMSEGAAFWEILKELPKTYQSPTMAPFCKDDVKYKVVENLVNQIKEIKEKETMINNQKITEILTVNGIRFSFEDGSWGLIRASSNKPSLVVVTESPVSNDRKIEVFRFIDKILQKTGKIGEYDQKI